MAKMDSERAPQTRKIAADYLQSFTLLLDRIDLQAVERVVQCLENARDNGGTIYVAGNGGSAATFAQKV